MATAKSISMKADAMKAILPLGCLHRQTPNNKAAIEARNTTATTRVKSGIPNKRSVWCSYVIIMLHWLSNEIARSLLNSVLAGILKMSNDQDKAAGTRRHNHWQAPLPPLPFILLFGSSIYGDPSGDLSPVSVFPAAT